MEQFQMTYKDMENKQVYIDCIENGGVLYHADGCRLEFYDGVFTITDGFLKTTATVIAPSGWSKIENLKRFDVVWMEREDSVMQVVLYTKREDFFIDSEGNIGTGKIKTGLITKCKQSEIHPSIAKFRERCIKEVKNDI